MYRFYIICIIMHSILWGKYIILWFMKDVPGTGTVYSKSLKHYSNSL